MTNGRLRRRTASVAGVAFFASTLLVLLPVWVPVAVVVDLALGRKRLPLTRLLAFALAWTALELAGVATAFGLWAIGRSSDHAAHYRLQRWWAGRLIGAMTTTTGMTISVDGLDALHPGPLVILGRHASLADSLVSAWLVTERARMQPRFVLKRELLADPCLDIVGGRIPNHFLDRDAADSSGELAALTALSTGMGDRDAAVIFPEGTRANPRKRERALARIAERDPDRAARLAALRHLLPPRPAGARALLAGAPAADVAVLWHTGFEGFDTFGGILRGLARPVTIRVGAWRVPRAEVPEGDAFTTWLDETWLALDAAADRSLHLAPNDDSTPTTEEGTTT